MRPAASHGLPRFLGLWPQRNSSSRGAPTGPVGGGREGEGEGLARCTGLPRHRSDLSLSSAFLPSVCLPSGGDRSGCFFNCPLLFTLGVKCKEHEKIQTHFQ